MIHLKAPQRMILPSFRSIFLAGSIEMGKAEMWQDHIVDSFKNDDIVFYNPRRDGWDSTWTQDPTPGTKFNEQVEWELEHIHKADLVVFYFDPNTQSPITLMELGYVIGSNKLSIVCCPDGYFRKGNVVITVSKSSAVTLVHKFDELLDCIRTTLIK